MVSKAQILQWKQIFLVPEFARYYFGGKVSAVVDMSVRQLLFKIDSYHRATRYKCPFFLENRTLIKLTTHLI